MGMILQAPTQDCCPARSKAYFPTALTWIRLRAFPNLDLMLGYGQSADRHTDHHSAPTNPMYDLHESRLMMAKEGLENAWARHPHWPQHPLMHMKQQNIRAN